MVSYFLRGVRTASGATAVQVMVKEGRRNRLVKHLGSAHDEAGLAALMEAGRRELVHPGQGELDLCLDAAFGAGSLQAVTVAKRSALLWRVLSECVPSSVFRPVGTAVGILDQIHPMRPAPNPFGTALDSCNPSRF